VKGRLGVVALAAALCLLAGGCQDGASDTGHEAHGGIASGASSPAEQAADDAGAHHGEVSDGHGSTVAAPKPIALRRGEKRMKLTMPEEYTPSAPHAVGTDDYRCFLLDPELTRDTYLTGTNVLPGNPQSVHHVILFKVTPDRVAEAQAKDAAEEGPGWTCFGGTGLEGDFSNVDDANWLGAWAPGGRESVARAGYGVDLARGSQIIMQVHYNLLAGDSPDASSAEIRVAPHSAGLTPLHTFLMPAPVELPCRAGHDSSPLCDRDAAVADVKARFGSMAGATADVLYFLCGGKPVASQVTSCTRPVQRPMTILGAAGHMHLLGRQIRIVTNPGTPRAKTVLDIAVWDFDNQGARPIEPVHLETWDTVEVACKHVQWLRDRLPSFEGQDERYVVWGEGTTDEMCLGMLQVAFD
jgi:hypothetical protein